MKNSLKNIILAIPLIATSACTIIPGSHMEGVSTLADNGQLEADLANVNIKLIDSKLFAAQTQLRRNAHSLITTINWPNFKRL